MSRGENGAENLGEPAAACAGAQAACAEREAADALASEAVEICWGRAGEGEPPEELVSKCADMRDARAWDRFLTRFNPLIVGTVARTIRRYGVDRAGLRDDLVQDVYLKLGANQARVLRRFKPLYRGGVFGYLRVIAANVVHDYFKTSAGKHPDDDLLPDDVIGEDKAEWWLLLREIDDLLWKSGTSERDRQIFWLYYRQGMAAKEIAAIPAFQLSTKGVEAAIVRLNRLVRDAFNNGERQ